MNQWTKERPTQEGYYWVRPQSDDNEDLTLRMRLAKVEFQPSKEKWLVFTPGGHTCSLEECNDCLWLKIELPELLSKNYATAQKGRAT